MALGDAYASVPELEARLGLADDGTFTALLDAASRAVEAFCRRQFNDAGSATARTYRALDPWRLAVDDFSTTTGLAVSIDGTAWAATDYEPRPVNGVMEGRVGWPFFDLFAVGRTWPYNRRATVSVTAQWGWAAVPEAIKQTTLNVAAALPRVGSGSGSGGGQVRSESIDGYSVSYATDDGSSGTAVVALSTFSLAEPYRRKRFGVA